MTTPTPTSPTSSTPAPSAAAASSGAVTTAGAPASTPATAQPGQPISPPPAATTPAGDPGSELKFELPADFTPPDGVTFTFDLQNPIKGPILREAVALASEAGLDQTTFSKFLAIDAKRMAAEHAAAAAELASERTKLGDNAEPRLAAVANWAKGLKDITAEEMDEIKLTASTAAGVSLLEKIIAKANGSVPGAGIGHEPKPPESPKSHAQRIWPGGFNAQPASRGGAR
jgi:hypothetical protein